MDDPARLNKPISDEELFDAGVTRDVPEREPVPPPPLTMPRDVNLSNVGVEYRAMGGITRLPQPLRRRRRAPDQAFAWVEGWRPQPPAMHEPAEATDDGATMDVTEPTPVEASDHAAEAPSLEPADRQD